MFRDIQLNDIINIAIILYLYVAEYTFLTAVFESHSYVIIIINYLYVDIKILHVIIHYTVDNIHDV